jgi:hypothetical protein
LHWQLRKTWIELPSYIDWIGRTVCVNILNTEWLQIRILVGELQKHTSWPETIFAVL